ncbi:hypothetical protein N7495_008488 [Penicillium taxi]|uniref:uncharacterized protein n=1 Tax=Penicillium taxi TaxID=168475 RepID=UPI0025459893|nr:uncharacterized protein N7495_008488 [Penicillium taxi]KAJ5888447.1 hypothetical protein N7495_008488 [Penicillium taxi]
MGRGPLEKKLKFTKDNKDLTKVPAYVSVETRPIPHAPVASPYAGADVPKIVYISSRTPFMSAVKRVKKLLSEAEKRATSGVNLEDTRTTEAQKLAELAKVAEKREEIFVKASGGAIEKALNLGKWFEEKSTEYIVRVTAGREIVVDDLHVVSEKKERVVQKKLRKEEQKLKETSGKDGESVPSAHAVPSADGHLKRKIEDSVPDDIEIPETRTRWIRTVEVAVSLK